MDKKTMQTMLMLLVAIAGSIGIVSSLFLVN